MSSNVLQKLADDDDDISSKQACYNNALYLLSNDKPHMGWKHTTKQEIYLK